MRIIAGRHRGLKLAEVGAGDAAAHLRPTADRVREALFNILLGGRFGDPVTGARVLDLFAGTGALGLECLSRGAAHVTFVDNGRVAQGLIRANLGLTGRAGDATLLPLAANRIGPGGPCGLIFLDPPYGQALGAPALAAARAGGWVASGTLAVWEESRPAAPPAGWQVVDQRRYGDTHVTFLRAD